MLDEYLVLVSEIPDGELEEIRRALATGTVNPRDVKMRLARDIVRQFHGEVAAREAEAEFVRVFQQRELPSEIPTYTLSEWKPIGIIDLLRDAELASSGTAARNLIAQGGVRIDDEKVEDIELMVQPREGMIIRVGKRRFRRITRGDK
jgi:tyrosyl-tRNA synthetase